MSPLVVHPASASAYAVPPPSPLVGNGLSPSPLKPLRVSLSLTPASNNGITKASLGAFRVELDRPAFSTGQSVRLSVYRMEDGQEKLVRSVNLDQQAQALGGPVAIPSSGLSFMADLSDKVKFPRALEFGYYRAEAVVYTLSPPISHPMHSDPKWVEAGGAAAEFFVGPVNLWPVSKVSGTMTVAASVIPKKGATKAQIERINGIARILVARTSGGIKSLFEGQSRASVGDPIRNTWFFKSDTTVNGLSSSWRVESGESYKHVVPTLNAQLQALVKSGTVVSSLPEGTISMKTTSTISFVK